MKKKILLSLLVLVALFTVTGCGGKKESTKKKVDGRTVVNYNSAFFIKEDNKYALFSDSGKKLTDFVYTYASNFANGAALVRDENGTGVIDTNGKMVVEIGKYKYVNQEGALYKLTDEERNEILINAKGKKIADMKDKTLTTFIGVNDYLFLYDKTKDEYALLNIDGDTILKFPKGNAEDKPSTNSEKNFLSIYNDGKNYIVDLINGKKVIEFDADGHYCVNNASDDGKIITLNSCVGMFQKQDETKYKFIKDGKLYDLSDKCDKVYYSYENLVCTKDNKNYLLNSKLELGVSLDGIAYTDNEHYVKAKSGSFNGIDFYENDKVVKNVPCRTMHEYGYSKSGFIILSTYYSTTCGTKSGSSDFYTIKGEKAFDTEFARVEKFDENNLARVTEDTKTYYLIDTKGKKVSEVYDTINARYGYYTVVKDKLVGVLDKKGKTIVEPKYTNIELTKQNGVIYAELKTEEGKYIIYNVDTKKEIITLDTAPTKLTDYMTITKDGKKVYYTYTGKEFYSEK